MLGPIVAVVCGANWGGRPTSGTLSKTWLAWIAGGLSEKVRDGVVLSIGYELLAQSYERA